MSDLVARLRNARGQGFAGLDIAAADAIEALEAEVARYREALELIVEEYRRRSEGYEPEKNRSSSLPPTGRAWGDGYHTATAHFSLVAREALDPEGFKKEDELWRNNTRFTDKEWFAKTGHCGHCGIEAQDCTCELFKDPCGCGPHELRTEPLECYRCEGKGVIDPPGVRWAKAQLKSHPFLKLPVKP